MHDWLVEALVLKTLGIEDVDRADGHRTLNMLRKIREQQPELTVDELVVAVRARTAPNFAAPITAKDLFAADTDNTEASAITLEEWLHGKTDATNDAEVMSAEELLADDTVDDR